MHRFIEGFSRHTSQFYQRATYMRVVRRDAIEFKLEVGLSITAMRYYMVLVTGIT